MVTDGAGTCGVSGFIRISDSLAIGLGDVQTIFFGPLLFMNNMDVTTDPENGNVLYIDFLGAVTTGPGPRASQLQYSSGVTSPIPLMTDTPQTRFIAFGSASPVVGNGVPDEITETQFSWTAARDGTLSKLDVWVVATFAPGIEEPNVNITIEFIVRVAPFDSFFRDTSLTARIDMPAVTTSEARFHAADNVDSVTINKSDRVSLRVFFTSFASSFLSIDVGISAGMLFGANIAI